MTTSSEQVLPSPTKIRARKSRHRRNNSRGSITSPIKSPSRDCIVEGEGRNTLHPHDAVAAGSSSHHLEVSPSSFRYMGPATAIREHLTEDEYEHTEDHCKPSNVVPKVHSDQDNMNEVCFGCDGGCSDATCSSSKRSSQISADVESTCDSPARSPLRQGHESMLPTLGSLIDDPTTISPSVSTSNISESQTKPVPEKDSNENLNLHTDDFVYKIEEEEETHENTTATSLMENCTVNAALKRSICEQERPPKRSPALVQCMESVDSEANENRRGHAVKFRNIKVIFFP